MKANLRKILGLAALGVTLLTNTVPTWAGYRYTEEVYVGNSTSFRTGQGSMAGARYSADGRQYIGCYINAAPFVVCSASDRAGNYVGCVSNKAEHVDQLQKMTDSSYIRFYVNHGQTACQSIRIFNHSYQLR
jgi:hypothetical protein